MEFHLADDIGRYGIKSAMSNNYLDWFPAYLGRGTKMNLERTYRPTDVDLITPYGHFFLGDLAIDECKDAARFMTQSKIHEDTLTLTLATVSRAIYKGQIRNDSDVRITMGVPVDSFNKDTKRGLSELIVGAYVVALNGRQFKFNIHEINLAVEGVSTHKILCNKNQGVYRYIDIGSRTVNFGTVKNGLYVNKESGTLNYGYNERYPEEFTRKVIADLSAVWDHFNDTTYLLGGGAKYCSIHFIKYIANLHCAARPEFTNVLAFLANGEQIA